MVSTLTELGFRKRAGRVLTLDIGEGWLGWLGLNAASRAGLPGEVALHPIVGVRSHAVESCVAEGRGEALHAYVPPTVSEPLRYLVPESLREDWIFDSSGTNEVEVSAAVVRAVREFGLPFIRKTADLGSLASRLAEAYPKDQQAAYRWPTALWVAGQRDAAAHAVAAVQTAVVGRTDPAAEELTAFLAWLEARVTNVD